MRILALSDHESPYLWDYFTRDKLDGIDLILSCGDLKAEYLSFIATFAHCPVLYVHGNHDDRYEKILLWGASASMDNSMNTRGSGSWAWGALCATRMASTSTPTGK